MTYKTGIMFTAMITSFFTMASAVVAEAAGYSNAALLIGLLGAGLVGFMMGVSVAMDSKENITIILDKYNLDERAWMVFAVVTIGWMIAAVMVQ